MSIYVGYLGPAGSNSYLACKEIFDPINENHDFLFKSQNSILKIIESLSKNEFHLAVLPALSSSEGIVKTTIDNLLRDKYNLYKSGIRIIGSVKIPITFALLRKRRYSTKLKEIQSISIALQQCEEGMARYINVDKVPVESTSRAAQNAAKDECIGAVAPEICADLYGLDIVKRNLQGEDPNYTKFYIMGLSKPYPETYQLPSDEGRILISVQGSVRNLEILLNMLLDYGFHIYEIYSKIDKPSDWLYTYIFEIDGRDNEIRFQHLTLTLNQYKINWKLMGCYPADIEPIQDYLKTYSTAKQIVEINTAKIDFVGIKDYKVYFHDPVINIQDVINHLLIFPRAIVKTIAYKQENKIIFVSVPGNKEIEGKKLEAVLGFPPMFAERNDIKSLGIEIGAISPLSAINYQQVIDREVFKNDSIYCGYEKNNLSIKLNSNELYKIPNLIIENITRD